MNQAHALQPQPLRAPAAPPGQRLSALQFANAYLIELSVLAAMILRFAPEPYNILPYLILAAVAFTGRTGTIFALAGVWFVSSVNPGLADVAPLGSGTRYIVIAAALLAALLRASSHRIGDNVSAATVTTAAVAGAIIIHSGVFSFYPSVSVFKAALWGMVSLTIVSTIRGMTDEDVAKLHRFLLLFFAIIIITSLAMMPLAEARLKNKVGLQGLLNHPQMFGVLCALAGAYFFGTAISSPKPSWLALGMVVLSLQGVIESAARTGGFALILACAALVGLALARSPSFFRRTLPGLFSGRFAVLTAAAVAAAVINSAAVERVTEQFVRKNSRAEQATTAYDVSRGFIIREMSDNIQRYPAQGIGLGIQSATHLINVEIDKTTGLPLSAPVEKGVMWVAIFEELGLLLGLSVFGWILWGTARAINAGAAAGAGSIAYFFTNFAEATFFSPGAIGMLGLIIFYLGLARGSREIEPPVSLPAQGPAGGPLASGPAPAAW